MTPEITPKEAIADADCTGTGDVAGVFSMCDLEVKDTTFGPHSRIRLRAQTANIVEF